MQSRLIRYGSSAQVHGHEWLCRLAAAVPGTYEGGRCVRVSFLLPPFLHSRVDANELRAHAREQFFCTVWCSKQLCKLLNTSDAFLELPQCIQ